MNTRLTLPTIVALALPLGLLTPTGALAQAKDQPNSPPAAGRGRQVISNKLERIRLDTVSYDGLPLSEVMLNLREQAMRRDPEKRGINFLINNNPDPGEAPAAPAPMVGPGGLPLPPQVAEQVDVGAAFVKINPPLTDVRLVDVLDVVVKVADRRIKYTVEDYGVVFSPRGSESMRKEEISFAFPGGTPIQFLNAVQQQYQVDWVSVAEIPKEMADVHIPRLRMSQEAVGSLLRTGGENEPLGAVVSLYNQLGEQKPELGRLIVKGDPTKPVVVMFVPDKAATDAQPKVKVKAFSIWGITDAGRAKLQNDIDRSKEEAMKYASGLRSSSGLRSLEGSVAIHNDTSLLVATGSESFVDMVESIVNACLAKERAINPGAPMAAPIAPGR